MVARIYYVRGRVQGVGYRYFAQRAAVEFGVIGYARNLDDGRVEVYAAGSKAKLDDFAARLWSGPRFSDVRGVEETESAIQHFDGFHIR
jgi:acylphosphatase